MQQLDERPPMETIHLYVVREEEARPSLLPIIFSVLALLGLLSTGFFNPYKAPTIERIIRVPAIFLPLKTFTTSVAVIPTGSKTYSATEAHGSLTLTNGSVVYEQLPTGMIFSGHDGVEVVTDEAVAIPAGSASQLGFATVSAHAVTPGTKGNIAALDINQVYGTSLYIRNLQQFTGGKDSYTKTVVTPQDTQRSIEQARHTLIPHLLSGLFARPCKETVWGTGNGVRVTWNCQFVTYEIPRLPQVKVIHVTIAGKEVLLDVVYVVHQGILPPK